jgi:hypothetical protein
MRVAGLSWSGRPGRRRTSSADETIDEPMDGNMSVPADDIGPVSDSAALCFWASAH